jgi:hypothetical protein
LSRLLKIFAAIYCKVEENSIHITPHRILFDNKPQNDFGGLTINEIRDLLYEPLGPSSPLKINRNITETTLNKILFFLIVEDLCHYVKHNGSIRLTASGSLPKKVLQGLYVHKRIKDGMVESGLSKLSREEKILPIKVAHHISIITRMLKKVKGRLELTRKGISFIKNDNRQELFRIVFTAYTSLYNWAVNDKYTEFSVGQFGWGFTLYLLFQYGNKVHSAQFYCDKFLQAFPNFIELVQEMEYRRKEQVFVNCYILRSFERFTEWFGLTKASNSFIMRERKKIIVNRDILEQVFRFEI